MTLLILRGSFPFLLENILTKDLEHRQKEESIKTEDENKLINESLIAKLTGLPPIEVNDPKSYQNDPLWSDTHSLLNILKVNASKDSVLICYGDGKGNLDFGDTF